MKYTDEERQWVMDYPDYPSWLIMEAFKEKFGKEIKKYYVIQLRLQVRETSNCHYGRSGKSQDDNEVEWLASGTDPDWDAYIPRGPVSSGFIE